MPSTFLKRDATIHVASRFRKVDGTSNTEVIVITTIQEWSGSLMTIVLFGTALMMGFAL